MFSESKSCICKLDFIFSELKEVGNITEDNITHVLDQNENIDTNNSLKIAFYWFLIVKCSVSDIDIQMSLI